MHRSRTSSTLLMTTSKRFANLKKSTAHNRGFDTIWHLEGNQNLRLVFFCWWAIRNTLKNTVVCSLHHVATKIYKKTGQISFTSKAYNGRCIAEWLRSCFDRAMTNGFPDDENQIPLLYSCLKLGPKDALPYDHMFFCVFTRPPLQFLRVNQVENMCVILNFHLSGQLCQDSWVYRNAKDGFFLERGRHMTVACCCAKDTLT